MVMLVGSLILAAIILFVAYFLHSNNDEDPSIPYATYGSYPIIGHVFSFIGDRTKLLLECRQRYGECFRIKVFSQRYVMILSHVDWMNIIRNPSLQFAGLESGIRILDLSPLLLSQPEFDADSHRLYVKHLKNRDGLHPMVVEFVHRMRELMKNEKTKLEKNGIGSKWISSGLLEFSHRMLYQPSTLALFGEVDPTSIESDFRLFDKNFLYFYFPIPRFICSWFFPAELNARTRLHNSWLKNEDVQKISDFHRDRLALFAENSDWLSRQGSCSLITGLLWVSLTNTIPAVFWSILYILRDAKALETIKQEMDIHLPNVPLDAGENNSPIEDWTPEQLDSCVYLESAINETLRLTGAPLMMRKCVQQTQIVLEDGSIKTIKPGEMLAWFGGSSHRDANLFPEPTKFIFDRFLNRKAESVPGYMPFGAGKSICPGRFFVKYEIKTCVAMLLRYMEYTFEDKDTIPSQIRTRIGLGVAPPTKDIPINYRYKT